MEYKYLGQTDMKVSKLGFGTTAFANFYNDCKFEDNEESFERIQKLVDKAFDYGINYFDTSPWYGNSEWLLGKALEGRPRKSYYIATKTGRFNSHKPHKEWFDFSYHRTIQSVENSLKLMNCGYIDLIQIHDFEFAKDLNQIINETLPALDYLRSIGKVRYIGINSYSFEHLRKCLEESKVKINTILTFSHLCLDDASLLEHVEFFKEKCVGIINGSPLSMGLFTKAGPPDWHKVSQKVKDSVLKAFEYAEANNCDLTKLAFCFSVNQPDADITLCSFASELVLDENVKHFLENLNVNERTCLKEIHEKLFKPLNYKGYGDADVRHYWQKIKENATN